MSTAYIDLAGTASRIQKHCQMDLKRFPVLGGNRRLDLPLPAFRWFIDSTQVEKIGPATISKIGGVAQARVVTTATRFEALYQDLLNTVLDLGSMGGASKLSVVHQLETSLRRRFQMFLQDVRRSVQRSIKDHICHEAEGSPRPSSFSIRTLETLEQAYLESNVLTTVECRLVAQAAGITHQQVRTWFQNRRNRANRARRIASDSVLDTPTTQPVADPRRVISGLPKRPGKSFSDKRTDFFADSPKQDVTRVIRELPKRGVKKVLSVTSSTDSLASLDSASPPEIFQSPLDAKSSQAPNITFPSVDPSVPFASLILPPAWSTENLGRSPFEMGDMVCNIGEPNQTTFQKVLDTKLTLGPSPSFSSVDNLSSGGSDVVNTPPDDLSLQWLDFDGLDNDEFLSMLTNIVSSGGMGGPEDLSSGLDGDTLLSDNSLDEIFDGLTGLEAEIASLGSRGNTPSLTEQSSFDSLAQVCRDISMEMVVGTAPLEAEVQDVRPRVDRSPSLEEFLRERSPVIKAESASTASLQPSPISMASTNQACDTSVSISPLCELRFSEPSYPGASQGLETSAPTASTSLLSQLPFFDPAYSGPAAQTLTTQSGMGYPQYLYPSFPHYPAAQPFYPVQTVQDQQNHLRQVAQPVQAGYVNGWIQNAVPFDNAYVTAPPSIAESSRKGKWVFVEE